MNITKEDNKITLELSPEEDEIMMYFIHSRGFQVLYEYFDPMIESRKLTKNAEESIKVAGLFNNMTQEDRERFLKGEWSK